jgi:hypothetical protein
MTNHKHKWNYYRRNNPNTVHICSVCGKKRESYRFCGEGYRTEIHGEFIGTVYQYYIRPKKGARYQLENIRVVVDHQWRDHEEAKKQVQSLREHLQQLRKN